MKDDSLISKKDLYELLNKLYKIIFLTRGPFLVISLYSMEQRKSVYLHDFMAFGDGFIFIFKNRGRWKEINYIPGEESYNEDRDNKIYEFLVKKDQLEKVYDIVKNIYSNYLNNQKTNKDTVLEVATNKELFKKIYGFDIDEL